MTLVWVCQACGQPNQAKACYSCNRPQEGAWELDAIRARTLSVVVSSQRSRSTTPPPMRRVRKPGLHT